MEPAHSDPNSNCEKIAVPEPTGVLAQPWSARKLVGMLSVFGPAAIVASLGIGAGETIVVFRAGSWAGYDLLWVVLLACLVKGIFVTYLLGRYTAVSGEYIGHRLVGLPGPRGWLLILLIVIELAVAPLVWAAIAKPCGVLFCFLFQDALPQFVLLAPLKWDVTMGALVMFIVAGAFMMAGAAVLYPMLQRGEIAAGFQGWSLLTDQAHVWRNIHPWLVWVYYVCVVAALWGTLQALPEAYARVTHEFLDAIWPRVGWEYKKMRAALCVYLFIFTAILVWSGTSFNMLIQIASFLVSNFALALVMFAALYLNFKLPAAYRTRWPMLVGGILSAIVLSIFSVISGWGLAVKCLSGG